MSGNITYTHQAGTRWLMLRQAETIEQWGKTSGAVHSRLEVQARGDEHLTDLNLRVSHSGTQATPLEVEATLALPAEQVDLLIAILTEIRDHQKAQKAEREAWEREQANSEGPQ